MHLLRIGLYALNGCAYRLNDFVVQLRAMEEARQGAASPQAM